MLKRTVNCSASGYAQLFRRPILPLTLSQVASGLLYLVYESGFPEQQSLPLAQLQSPQRSQKCA